MVNMLVDHNRHQWCQAISEGQDTHRVLATSYADVISRMRLIHLTNQHNAIGESYSSWLTSYREVYFRCTKKAENRWHAMEGFARNGKNSVPAPTCLPSNNALAGLFVPGCCFRICTQNFRLFHTSSMQIGGIWPYDEAPSWCTYTVRCFLMRKKKACFLFVGGDERKKPLQRNMVGIFRTTAR